MSQRETFGSRLGLLATMIGVAVGLGNVWRFPYMVGKFGGASFVIFYAGMVVLVGVPALMAEWSLGRLTRRGPAGAFARGGMPGGRLVGWALFFVVIAAAAYYTNAIGWVLLFAVRQVAGVVGLPFDAARVLPPESGFDPVSFGLQVAMTAIVILGCAIVLAHGLRSGIERVSKVIMPILFLSLAVLIVRSLTLPGAWAGVEWYILKVDFAALTPTVMVAALGQAFFTLSLGGTFMVVYGSYLDEREPLVRSALWTAGGDLTAGLLAGFAILPAVFALGLEPGSGPGLIFFTLPEVFSRIPGGWVFGLLFFLSLFGAAYLSNIAAFEVLVAGLLDNFKMTRKKAVWTLAGVVFLFALPPMVSMKVFVPWDLTFGSGMQTLGSLLTVVTLAWLVKRPEALRQLAGESGDRRYLWLYHWLRFAVPGAILAVGIWWLLSDVLGVVGAPR